MVEDDARRLIRAINELQANDRVGAQISIDNAVEPTFDCILTIPYWGAAPLLRPPALAPTLYSSSCRQETARKVPRAPN